jgi:hypothetical protein
MPSKAQESFICGLLAYHRETGSRACRGVLGCCHLNTVKTLTVTFTKFSSLERRKVVGGEFE